MWHKQSFTQFWSQSDAYSRRSSLKLTYIHHPLVVCTHQICCAVAVPIALSQDRLLHGHNRLVNWTPCSRMRESKLTRSNDIGQGQRSSHATHLHMLVIICTKYGKNPSRTVGATEQTPFSRSRQNDLENIGQGQRSLLATHTLMLMMNCAKNGKNASRIVDFFQGESRKNLKNCEKL